MLKRGGRRVATTAVLAVTVLSAAAVLGGATGTSWTDGPSDPIFRHATEDHGLELLRDRMERLGDHPLAVQSLRSLDITARITDVLADAPTPNLQTAARLLAAAHPDTEPPALPAFDSPSAGATALLHLGGLEPNDHHEALRSLDEVGAPQRAALTGLFAAYLGYHNATQSAFAGVDWEALPDQLAAMEALWAADMGDHERDGASGPAALGIDASPVLAAYQQLLDAAIVWQTATAAMAPANPAETRPATLYAPPALIIDAHGYRTEHRHDAWLTLDVGGHDRYFNNAGGGRSPWAKNGCAPIGEAPTSAIWAGLTLDLAGDDDYAAGGYGLVGKCGKNGGAYLGAGALIDAGGNDTFTGYTHGVNGGATTGGIGLLVNVNDADADESDHFEARNGGTMGGARLGGLGHLISLGGNSRYQGPLGYTTGGVIGGAQAEGIGFLVDAGGNDTYEAFGLGAIGGGDAESRGFLYDDSGDDTYHAGSSGVNGGAYRFATGLLYDGGGDDTYNATGHGSNGGARTHAIGILYDAGGDDEYHDRDEGANGGGAAGGLGHLVDDAGDDWYNATLGGVNGGGFAFGAGYLYDGAGDDTYNATSPLGANGGADARPDCGSRRGIDATFECTISTRFAFAGLLTDRAGRDTYDDGDAPVLIDTSIFPKGQSGLQWDSDDHPDAPAPPGSSADIPILRPSTEPIVTVPLARPAPASVGEPAATRDAVATALAADAWHAVPAAAAATPVATEASGHLPSHRDAVPTPQQFVPGAPVPAAGSDTGTTTTDPVGEFLRPVQDALVATGNAIGHAATAAWRAISSVW